METTAALVWGIVGGSASELLQWFRIRQHLHKGIPEYAKNWQYWGLTILMVGMGGVLVIAYHSSSEVSLSPILAMNIGASAPLILSAFVAQTPSVEYGTLG